MDDKSADFKIKSGENPVGFWGKPWGKRKIPSLFVKISAVIFVLAKKIIMTELNCGFGMIWAVISEWIRSWVSSVIFE